MKTDLGLLILRVSIGSMMLVSHGWSKLTHFGTISERFPDPLGVGPVISLTLVVFAEVFCSAAQILGLGTRLASFVLAINMSVAAFVVHMDGPWQKKEFAILYLIPYVVMIFTGGGGLSIDALWKNFRKK